MERTAALGALQAGISNPDSETGSCWRHKVTPAAEQCACCFKSRMLLRHMELLKVEC